MTQSRPDTQNSSLNVQALTVLADAHGVAPDPYIAEMARRATSADQVTTEMGMNAEGRP